MNPNASVRVAKVAYINNKYRINQAAEKCQRASSLSLIFLSFPPLPPRIPFFPTFFKERRSREFVQLSTRSRGTKTRRDFSCLFPFERVRVFLGFSTLLVSVVLWIKEKGRERERRCNYLFQIFEIFAGGLLLVVRELLEKWGWWWTIRRGNVSFSLCYLEIVDLRSLKISFLSIVS